MADLQERDVKAFCDAVRGGDIPRMQQLLASTHVRKRINDPMFAFGQRAAHIAAKNEGMLTTLIAAGADVNLKSDWENGPDTVLDNADEDTARFLLARGVTLTPNVAARLGWLDELQALVKADGALVHARGGDGQQPLHEARTVAIAEFLLDHGAEVDARCIDHKSTNERPSSREIEMRQHARRTSRQLTATTPSRFTATLCRGETSTRCAAAGLAPTRSALTIAT